MTKAEPKRKFQSRKEQCSEEDLAVMAAMAAMAMVAVMASAAVVQAGDLESADHPAGWR